MNARNRASLGQARAFMRSMVEGLAAEQSAEQSSSALLFPLRFLGSSLLIAWLCCTHIVGVFPVTGATHLEARNFTDLFMRAGDIGAFVLLAMAAPRIGSLAKRPALMWTGVCASAGGTALCGFALIPHGGPSPLLACMAVLTAVGGALLFCLWAQVLTRMGGTRAIVSFALSCIAAMAASLLICALRQPWALVITCLLPLASMMCARASMRLVDMSAEPAWPDQPRTHRLPWKLIALMVLAGFMSAMSGLLLSGQTGGAIHRVIATGLAGLGFLVAALVWRERCDARMMARAALPLAVIGLAALPLAQGQAGALVSVAGKLAYVWLTLFVLMMLSGIAQRSELPTLRLFAVARACSEGAILAGIVARNAIWRQGLHLDQTFLLTFMAAGTLGVLAGVLIWKSERAVNGDWGAAGSGPHAKLMLESRKAAYQRRCQLLARRFGLTERETEVLALLGRQQSRTQIERALHLSENTVKTHVRHIYRKLGVNSKSQVVAMIEGIDET
ncbi:helix-turn-helix transcriptional regulator [Eggerthellaceae bacterium zg-997]|nr:helix-turn-helix transcriptional regulator [Eggerthellaceae bacterium zg-997]